MAHRKKDFTTFHNYNFFKKKFKNMYFLWQISDAFAKLKIIQSLQK